MRIYIESTIPNYVVARPTRDISQTARQQLTLRPEGFRAKCRLTSLLPGRRLMKGMGFPSPASQIPKLCCALARNAVALVAPGHPAVCSKQHSSEFSDRLFTRKRP